MERPAKLRETLNRTRVKEFEVQTKTIRFSDDEDDEEDANEEDSEDEDGVVCDYSGQRLHARPESDESNVEDNEYDVLWKFSGHRVTDDEFDDEQSYNYPPDVSLNLRITYLKISWNF